MISFNGRSTAIARRVRGSRSARTHVSNCSNPTAPSFLVIPTRSQKSRSAPGVNPRRRMPAMVGIRGSSHPPTYPPSTRRVR